jgi:hypothetical protein
MFAIRNFSESMLLILGYIFTFGTQTFKNKSSTRGVIQVPALQLGSLEFKPQSHKKKKKKKNSKLIYESSKSQVKQ